MTSTPLTVRRASVEDIEPLRELWRRAGFAAADLDRRLTEFQVALGPDGKPSGCIALHVEGRLGRIHSEIVPDTPDADSMRAEFWKRLQNLARNFGLFRVYMDEPSDFWIRQGFAPPPAEQNTELPAAFGPAVNRHVLILQEETEILRTLEHEFDLFRAEQNRATEEVLGQVRSFRILAYILLVVAMIVGAVLIAMTVLARLKS